MVKVSCSSQLFTNLIQHPLLHFAGGLITVLEYLWIYAAECSLPRLDELGYCGVVRDAVKPMQGQLVRVQKGAPPTLSVRP